MRSADYKLHEMALRAAINTLIEGPHFYLNVYLVGPTKYLVCARGLSCCGSAGWQEVLRSDSEIVNTNEALLKKSSSAHNHSDAKDSPCTCPGNTQRGDNLHMALTNSWIEELRVLALGLFVAVATTNPWHISLTDHPPSFEDFIRPSYWRFDIGINKSLKFGIFINLWQMHWELCTKILHGQLERFQLSQISWETCMG